MDTGYDNQNTEWLSGFLKPLGCKVAIHVPAGITPEVLKIHFTRYLRGIYVGITCGIYTAVSSNIRLKDTSRENDYNCITQKDTQPSQTCSGVYIFLLLFATVVFLCILGSIN